MFTLFARKAGLSEHGIWRNWDCNLRIRRCEGIHAGLYRRNLLL